MHPAAGIELGGDQIRASWEYLVKICSKGRRVGLRDQRISVNDGPARETSTHQVNVLIAKEDAHPDPRVSNVFGRQSSEWRWFTTTVLRCNATLFLVACTKRCLL
jgi:hypothetical protein